MPRGTVRLYLAKYHYLLGKVYAARHQYRAGLSQVGRAIRISPLVGRVFVTEEQPWWRRWVILATPYLHLCRLLMHSTWYFATRPTYLVLRKAGEVPGTF